MKKAKRIISLVLAAVLSVASFAGCASGEKSTNIVIGGSGPLTGSAAQYGIAVKNAAQLAVNEINDAGGVNGTKFELHFEDDEADPGDKAVNAYNALKDKGMQVFLGTVTTGSCLAVIEKSNADRIFQFTPSASAADVIKNDNCFQICFTDPNQGKASADYIAENGIAKKVAVIYDSSDAYSSGIYNTFVSRAKENGLEVVTEQSFTKDSKTDFSAQISAAKTAGAELVFLPIYYQEASLILSQAKSAGYSPKFFGCDGLDGILTTENFDASLAEGVMLLTPFAADADDEATQKFVEAYKAAYGEVPNQFAADAYDGVKIIAQLVEQQKITPDMDTSEICDKLIAAITASDFSYNGLTGENMQWDESGAVSKNPKAVIIKDGAYSALD
ncbi:MAG: amino acid ABC transporter substrate-binding protein [Ruminococcus sp.]|nr:amino acid ABC transporter substrate-binding protein [Ruminococcus sp.]